MSLRLTPRPSPAWRHVGAMPRWHRLVLRLLPWWHAADDEFRERRSQQAHHRAAQARIDAARVLLDYARVPRDLRDH